MSKVFGIDVSRWQGNFDFKRAAAEGVKFVVLRGAYSAPFADGGKDAKFEEFYKAAKAAGLAVGVYQYSMAQNSAQAVEEARYLYSNCLAGKQFELPIYFDIEDAVHKKPRKRTNTDIVKAWCSYLEERGFFVGVYSFKAFFDGYLFDGELQHYTHWVAQWADSCTYQPGSLIGMWQFGGETNTIRTNKVAGVTCDQNYMYRDFPAEIKKLGLNGYTKEEVKISMGEITGINTSRGTNALVLITDGRATTGFNKWGVDVIVNGKGIITQIVDGKSNTPIPKGCICLSGHNNAGWYLKQHCKVGARLKIG